ncbi:glycosyltransferase family 2 protein [Marinobacter sp.]|uniref:glycosyltransferase family 2 protein n=1 Tax=Marinobacter sp. TaxID=50741 RepID=UPI002B267E38|nr:glycosyltransferase family 2 protein [Marinobacter sp.]
MNKKQITGLILHFRTPQKTLACLNSLQDEGIGKAVIIDNSEDHGKSIDSIQDNLNALNGMGLSTEILSPNHNLGFAEGVNAGLTHIQSKQANHVLLINSDAYLATGSLERMYLELQASPFVSPHIARCNHAPSSPLVYYDCLLGLITPTPKVKPLRYTSGCCLLIHRDHAKAPLFDQDFFFYGEDVMLSHDAQKNGYSVRLCRSATVYHETSSSAKNGSLFYEYHINRAHWLLARKLSNHPFELILFIVARCFTLPLRALVRSVRFRSLTAWNGLFAATIDILGGRRQSVTPPIRHDQ